MNPNNLINIQGQKFGRWTVLEKVKVEGKKEAYWLCRCDCGAEKKVLGKNLRNGRSTSCGCYKKEQDSIFMSQYNKEHNSAIDITGQKYGLLTPIKPTKKRLSSSVVWECLCDCGNITYVSVDNLRGKHPVRSCGCLGSSYGEKVIEDILKENSIKYIKEYRIQNLKRFDFAILDEKENIVRLIEFDGEQHFKNVPHWDTIEIQQKRDKEKNEYALSHNIPLIRIPYWERNNISLELIMSDKYLVKKESYEST